MLVGHQLISHEDLSSTNTVFGPWLLRIDRVLCSQEISTMKVSRGTLTFFTLSAQISPDKLGIPVFYLMLLFLFDSSRLLSWSCQGS